MAAPDYVPHPKDEKPRTYSSPPWRPESWEADRPAELSGRQPLGPRLGYPGPDQGYVLKLARSFSGKLSLTEGEHEKDALAGCSAVALKRASLYGRAPVIHDLRIALLVWGFLAPQPDAELVRLRKPLFEEASNPHHYMELRRIVDLVPIAVLKLTPAEVERQAATDWRAFFKRKSAGVG